MTQASTRMAAREKVLKRLRRESPQATRDSETGIRRIRKQSKNRRLYDYRESKYVTCADLVRFVKGPEQLLIESTDTGEDVTLKELLSALARAPGAHQVLTLEDVIPLIRKLPD